MAIPPQPVRRRDPLLQPTGATAPTPGTTAGPPTSVPPATGGVAGRQTGSVNGNPLFTGNANNATQQMNQTGGGTPAANGMGGTAAGGGGGAASQPGAPTGNDASSQGTAPQNIDSLEEQFVRNSLQGPRDTSKDQALIQQEDQQLLGNQLYNQRAAMGASGFGASGAAVGLENTARRNMASQAANDILGVQNQARNDYFNQGNTAIGSDIAKQNAANQQAILQAQAQAMQAILGGGGDGTKPAAGAAAAAGAGAGTGFGSNFGDTVDPGRGLHSDTPATAGTPNTPATAPTQVNQPPPGSTPDGKEGDITYYKGPDGKEYYVKG